jgi:hypothetical protein
MQEAVEHGCGQDLVAQELLPCVQAPVGGQHQRAAGVAVSQELAEGAAGRQAQGMVADLVEDDQLGSQPLIEEVRDERATPRAVRLSIR